MDTELQFKRKIMRRIYIAYALRRLGEPVAREVVILAFLGLISSFLVSLRSVVANASAVHDPGALYIFFSNAFAQAHALVKIIFVAGVFTAFVFIVNITRQVSSTVIQRFA